MSDTLKKGIELKNVSSGYGRKKILDNVSVFIPEGEITVILGENGSGKTTMLRTIAGLLDYE